MSSAAVMLPAAASSGPDGLELPAHRGQGLDDVVLRQFPQPGKHPGAFQRRPHQRCPQPAPLPRGGNKPLHLGLCIAGRFAEQQVGGLAGIVQPQVVGQDSEDMGRVVGPARHPEVYLRHGTVPVAAQEAGEPGLHDGGQLTGPVAADQLRHPRAVER